MCSHLAMVEDIPDREAVVCRASERPGASPRASRVRALAIPSRTRPRAVRLGAVASSVPRTEPPHRSSIGAMTNDSPVTVYGEDGPLGTIQRGEAGMDAEGRVLI